MDDLTYTLAAVVGYLSALSVGVLIWRTPLKKERIAHADTKETLKAFIEQNNALLKRVEDLGRTRYLVRPLTAVEIASLAKHFCGTCEGRGYFRGGMCKCTKARIEAKLAAGEMVERDGAPWAVEKVSA